MPQRQRVTITIRDDLLHRLDDMIDHEQVRNRSHAVEVLLNRLLETKVSQAVILASGQGVNMRPFTYEIPKPLIPVNGRPLLENGIELLRQHGIRDIVITVSHLANKIEEHFGSGSKFGVNIKYVHEKKPSGTGGALLAARKHLADAAFVLMHADILMNLDLTELIHTHETNDSAVATLALTSVADPSAFGAVKLRGTRIVEFSEKPTPSSETSRLVFAGLGVFDTAVFNYFPKGKRRLVSLEEDILPALAKQGRLYGYPFEGQWFDVSTPQIYERVLKSWPR